MLVRRPGTLLVRTLSIGNNEDEAYPCTMCGPPCPTDIGAAGTDDPDLADHITENLAAAVQNRYPLPNHLPTYAGTVSCKTCFGQGRVKRMTPAMERLLGLEDSWALRLAERMGRRYFLRANRPRDRPRLFMEFPQGPQRNADFPWGLNREKMKIRFSRPVQRRGPEPALPLRHGPIDIIFTSKPSLEKFVLPFVKCVVVWGGRRVGGTLFACGGNVFVHLSIIKLLAGIEICTGHMHW